MSKISDWIVGPVVACCAIGILFIGFSAGVQYSIPSAHSASTETQKGVVSIGVGDTLFFEMDADRWGLVLEATDKFVRYRRYFPSDFDRRTLSYVTVVDGGYVERNAIINKLKR